MQHPAPPPPPGYTSHQPSPDIIVMVREPDTEEVTVAEKKERRGIWMNNGLNVMLFAACAANTAGIFTPTSNLSMCLVVLGISIPLGLICFAAGMMTKGLLVRAGPIENYVNARHWNRLYTVFLKDLIHNMNGDLVQVWKRHELVIKKLGLWRD